ncbi:glycosyltransferase family 2 protein [Ornithinimicrobium pratense]|uniref:Glycosyltransferase family 2 protein n=1 Tax=Ornithinimicrobium pratense TaxID=2593973 RepID=A0A5J6V283_9MICO|nr:galactosyltransferase-related protein [Ornithinimicrobium pratense]QFG67404.1 glycosyltransferase family 2 protein [Ornithinimicrobium pratense]
MTDPLVAVLTIAHGRHDHLRGQIAGLAQGTREPDLHVVAAMDDPEVARVAADAGARGSTRRTVVDVPADPRGLPLAAARNLAAAEATAQGADHLVFLDVDCIPGPTTVAAYAGALEALTGQRPSPAVLGGDVAYLPPLPAGQRDWTGHLGLLPEAGEHRPDRVRLAPGEHLPEPDLNRFWSLSFAMTVVDFWAIGGFCPDYVGYGGEDTDFAQVVGARGGSLTWVGGATAYHQHHPSPSPPLNQLEPVVRNAGVFADRWGWWPMEGWLEGFRERGLAAPDQNGRWRVTA